MSTNMPATTAARPLPHPLARVIAAFAHAVALLAPAPAAADPIKVTAGVTARGVYLGDAIEYRIIVEGAEPDSPAPTITIDGARASFSRRSNTSSSFVRIINGRRTEQITEEYVLHYSVAPMRAGVLTVPPVTVRVNGRELVTEPVNFRVVAPEESEQSSLNASASERRLYVGQPTTLTLTWTIDNGANVQDFSFRSLEAPEGFDVGVRPNPAARQDPRRFPQVSIMGLQTNAQVGRRRVGGETVTTVQVEVDLTPTRPGTFALDDLIVSYTSRVGRVARRYFAQADPITIEAEPLPAAGRPANFTGLIGTHDIRAEATPTVVNVGDPIRLTVTITGREPMAGVTDGPDLANQPGFAEAFRLAPEGWRGVDDERFGRRVFTTTIRAAHEGVDAIPPVELPFFDVSTDAYRRAMSEPIPLEVRSVQQVTLADAVGAPSAGMGVARETLSMTDPGVWAIERGPAVLAGTRTQAYERPEAWIVAGLLPPLAFTGALGWRAWADRTDRATRRRRSALSRARARLRRDGPAAAVRGYLADLSDRDASSITTADCDAVLGESEEADALRRVLFAAEASRFGESAVSQPSASETAELLARADRRLRGSA